MVVALSSSTTPATQPHTNSGPPRATSHPHTGEVCKHGWLKHHSFDC